MGLEPGSLCPSRGMGCLVICREKPQLAMGPALGLAPGEAPHLVSGKRGPGRADKRLVIDAVTAGRPVFISGLQVLPAGCFRASTWLVWRLQGWNLHELGSLGGWGRAGCTRLIALCLLVLLWRQPLGPGRRHEALGSSLLVLASRPVPADWGLFVVTPHLLGWLPCRASPAPPCFLHGMG